MLKPSKSQVTKIGLAGRPIWDPWLVNKTKRAAAPASFPSSTTYPEIHPNSRTPARAPSG